MTRKSLAAALLSSALLAEEVVAGRLLSVLTWYSLGYLALSLGLLGMTAGALAVHLRPRWFVTPLGPAIAASLAAVAVASGALWLVRTHLALDIQHPARGVATIAEVAAVIALPFAGGGAALAWLLATAERPGTLYAADLAGAAAGALLAGPLIAWLGAPRALVATALALALAASLLGGRRLAVAALPAALALVWPGALDLRWAKDRTLDPARPPLLQGWTSFAHARAEEHRDLPPFYWAALAGAPEEPVRQAFIRIDGEAGTAAYAFSEPRRDLRFLESDVTFAPFVLRPPERVLVLGSGAGRDLLSANLAGARTVQGVEINGLLVRWLQGPLGELSPVLRLPGVSVAVGDGRAFAASTEKRYDLVVASLVDTWASTGAGALSLTENALYTEEAWTLFLDRLTDRGVLAFARWFDPSRPLEMARLVALAASVLRRQGVDRPRAHVAVVTRGQVAVVLLSRTELSPAERDRLRAFCAAGGARLAEEPLLLEVLEAGASRLEELSAREGVDLRAPTDDRPFFFLQVPPSALLSTAARERLGSGAGLFHGNVLALFAVGVAFAVSTALAALALLGPLAGRVGALRSIPPGRRAALLGYFALLGAGFMLFEIASAERLHTLLGTPTWAVALTLGPLALGAGLGAALSEVRPVRPRRAALLGAVLLSAAAASGGVVDAALLLPLAVRAVLTSCALFCISVPLGTLLPAGLRAARAGAIPWCWGVNGLASVGASGGAVLISVTWGISRALLAAAAAYALAALLAPRGPGDEGQGRRALARPGARAAGAPARPW